MNLIEQCGGYEETKEYLKKNSHFIDFEGLERFYDELLEYRREQNIFEVGDKVVLLNWDNNSRLLTIKRVYEHKLYKCGEYCYSTFIYYVKEWCHDHAFSKRDIRYATPQEIKAGRRL